MFTCMGAVLSLQHFCTVHRTVKCGNEIMVTLLWSCLHNYISLFVYTLLLRAYITHFTVKNILLWIYFPTCAYPVTCTQQSRQVMDKKLVPTGFPAPLPASNPLNTGLAVNHTSGLRFTHSQRTSVPKTSALNTGSSSYNSAISSSGGTGSSPWGEKLYLSKKIVVDTADCYPDDSISISHYPAANIRASQFTAGSCMNAPVSSRCAVPSHSQSIPPLIAAYNPFPVSPPEDLCPLPTTTNCSINMIDQVAAKSMHSVTVGGVASSNSNANTNTTESVRVASSFHVAEIVGKQGKRLLC